MRMSSSLVAVAILSTALLSSFTGAAMSQTTTGSGTQLPNVTVEAPKQAARPQRPQVTARGSGRVVHRGRASRSAQVANGTPSYARGSVMWKLAKLRERSQQLQRWLQIELRTQQGPLGWMQRIGWVVHGFLGHLQRHTHPQGLRAMRGNRNVYGLGTPTSLVAMHNRHAGRGRIPGHNKSKRGHTIADS